MDPHRRAFLDHAAAWGSLGLLSVLGGRFAAGLARYVAGPGRPMAGGAGAPARIAASELDEGGGKVVAAGGRPVLVSRVEGEVHAVSARCTHLGCIVRWDPAAHQVLCPCHGARYRPTGEVLSGPTHTPLEAVTIRREGGDLVVGG